MSPATAIGLASLGIWAYLLLGRGRFWSHLPRLVAAPPARWPAIVAVVPARDEAEAIGAAVRSLLTQDYAGPFGLVVVDDHSTDGTAEMARQAAAALGRSDRLRVVTGKPLPRGWSGKLWAVQQGLQQAHDWMPEADYVLLTDADIAHDRHNLAELAAHAEAGALDLTSLMVQLHCDSLAERCLIPAFVYFFAMLYPFAWVNRPAHRMAGAAGGCMLVRRTALARIGGVEAVRSDLIDDCALAQKIKPGGPIWLGFGTRTRSLRVYGKFSDIWSMVARTAFHQLDHSVLLLAVTVTGMALTFLAPPALLLVGGAAGLMGALSWAAMAASYIPMLRRYRRTPLWAPFLPLIALFYVSATIDSAWRHQRGRGGAWKGRVYAKEDA